MKNTLTLSAAAMLVSVGLSAPAAQANYIVTLTQQGSNVVEIGNGSLDLTALQFFKINSPPPPGGEEARIDPSIGLVVLGPTTATSIAVYTGLTGPSSFGSVSSFEDASSGSGALVGVAGSLAPVPILGVPVGYVSGSSLGRSTDTWDDTTIASLGVTPGVYTWTWGSGKDADSFRLVVTGPRPFEQLASLSATPSAVPEPSTWALMLIGFAGLGFASYRASRRTASSQWSASLRSPLASRRITSL